MHARSHPTNSHAFPHRALSSWPQAAASLSQGLSLATVSKSHTGPLQSLSAVYCLPPPMLRYLLKIKAEPLIKFCFSCFATWLGAHIKAQHGGHGVPTAVPVQSCLSKLPGSDLAQGEGAVCICSSQGRSEARAWAGPLLPWPCSGADFRCPWL